jgi:low affinity Fe/Cu permease
MPNGKPNGREKTAFERIGCDISSWVSDVAANPFAQLGVVVICTAWFALGLNTNVLTAVLSILAISLTQMVLNRQNEREAEAHRRDVAMHAKLDELVFASKRARDEMAGIEELEEDEIEHLKEDAKDAIQAAEEDSAGPAEQETARSAVKAVNQEIQEKAKKRVAARKPRPKAAAGARH